MIGLVGTNSCGMFFTYRLVLHGSVATVYFEGKLHCDMELSEVAPVTNYFQSTQELFAAPAKQ